jgi:hypothetical protein
MPRVMSIGVGEMLLSCNMVLGVRIARTQVLSRGLICFPSATLWVATDVTLSSCGTPLRRSLTLHPVTAAFHCQRRPSLLDYSTIVRG